MRILIAEDDSVSRRILEINLRKWGHEVISTTDGAAALEAFAQADPPRIAILDWMMPEMDGVEVCRTVNADEERPFTYIIMLTAKGQKDDIVSALEAGADDYVTKPWDPEELRARVGVAKRFLKMQSDLEEANEALTRMACTDGLTQVLNRRAIMTRVEEEVARSARESRPLCLFMADIDHFKRINDTYGHTVGDEILKGVTARLQEGLRIYDGVGRYGGEEFLAVLPGAKPDSAKVVGERIRKAVAESPLPFTDGSVDVTISVGALLVRPSAEASTYQLISQADRLLYQAKENGRNRVETGAFPSDAEAEGESDN